jgi:hypothetical protein
MECEVGKYLVWDDAKIKRELKKAIDELDDKFNESRGRRRCKNAPTGQTVRHVIMSYESTHKI